MRKSRWNGSRSARAFMARSWRVHGAFSAFIPVGNRIGRDAKESIKAELRGRGEMARDIKFPGWEYPCGFKSRRLYRRSQ